MLCHVNKKVDFFYVPDACKGLHRAVCSLRVPGTEMTPTEQIIPKLPLHNLNIGMWMHDNANIIFNQNTVNVTK